MDEETPLSFMSSSRSQNNQDFSQNPSHWNLKFRKFTLKSMPSAINSDLIVVNKDILDMPKFNTQHSSLAEFWKDLAADILTPFAPKNHSLLRFLNKNVIQKCSSPQHKFLDSPRSSLKKSPNTCFSFSRPQTTRLLKPTVVCFKPTENKHFSGRNKSFELKQAEETTEKSPKNKGQLWSIHRKSCHCSECGPLTRFQADCALKTAKTRYQLTHLQRLKDLKISMKNKVNRTVAAKRGSFLKLSGKKNPISLPEVNSPQKSYTNLPNSFLPNPPSTSYTSFDTLSGLSMTKSGLLTPQFKEPPPFPSKTHRKSAMGFLYQARPSLGSITSSGLRGTRKSTLIDSKVIEEEKPMGHYRRVSTETDRTVGGIQGVLRNKELRKKERELIKLLGKGGTGDRFLQKISNLKIDCKNTGIGSFFEYFPPEKNKSRPDATSPYRPNIKELAIGGHKKR